MRLASSQEAFEKRGWGVLALIFDRLRRGKEFATTGWQNARLREDITASRRLAMPKSCYRGLAEGSGRRRRLRMDVAFRTVEPTGSAG